MFFIATIKETKLAIMLSILISMQFLLQTGASSKASCASTFRYFAESQGLGEEQISYKWHGNQPLLFFFSKGQWLLL